MDRGRRPRSNAGESPISARRGPVWLILAALDRGRRPRSRTRETRSRAQVLDILLGVRARGRGGALRLRLARGEVVRAVRRTVDGEEDRRARFYRLRVPGTRLAAAAERGEQRLAEAAPRGYETAEHVERVEFLSTTDAGLADIAVLVAPKSVAGRRRRRRRRVDVRGLVARRSRRGRAGRQRAGRGRLR